jgi:hypothetical protein
MLRLKSVRLYSSVVIHQVALFCAILYCRLWIVSLYHIFPHYLVNDTISEKQFIERKMLPSIFFTTFFRNIFHSEILS